MPHNLVPTVVEMWCGCVSIVSFMWAFSVQSHTWGEKGTFSRTQHLLSQTPKVPHTEKITNIYVFVSPFFAKNQYLGKAIFELWSILGNPWVSNWHSAGALAVFWALWGTLNVQLCSIWAAPGRPWSSFECLLGVRPRVCFALWGGAARSAAPWVFYASISIYTYVYIYIYTWRFIHTLLD